MSIKKDVYEAYRAHIAAHPDENYEGAQAMMVNLTRSPLNKGHELNCTPLQIPKIFDEEDVALFSYITKTAQSICCKMIDRYLKDPAYRTLFPFDEETEQLILSPAGYEALLPVARYDIFYHEDTGDYGFCEINTDGTSAMNEDFWLDKVYIHNPAHQAVRREYELVPFDLFTPWVETFLRLYKTWKDPRGLAPHTPNVAIVDFLDRGMVREFEEFARRFQEAGVDSQVVDPREMTYKDGLLYSKEGYLIDAIYRRAVTADVMAEKEHLADFLSCVKDGNVFMAGGFRTQVVHTKWTFLAMHRPETKAFLSEEEVVFIDAHIPYTVDLSEDGIAKEEVLRRKDEWIIKPYDDYGASGVVAGRSKTPTEWEEVIDRAYGQGYICQAYYPQYYSDNIDLTGDAPGRMEPYINMSGLFSYDGTFAGVYSRQSNGDIIASHASGNERNQPTYVVQGLR